MSSSNRTTSTTTKINTSNIDQGKSISPKNKHTSFPSSSKGKNKLKILNEVASLGDDGDWKKGLIAPEKDTRIKTDVSLS